MKTLSGELKCSSNRAAVTGPMPLIDESQTQCFSEDKPTTLILKKLMFS